MADSHESLIYYLLQQAGDRDIRDVGPTKLCGLLYLADVEHYVATGSKASDVEWEWNDYGPFHVDVAYGPKQMSDVTQVQQPGGISYTTIRERAVDISKSAIDSIDKVLDQFGDRNGAAIKKYCYASTAPMLQAQEGSGRGVMLQFSSLNDHRSDVQNAASRLKGVQPLQQRATPTDPTHTDELTSVIRRDADLRRLATDAIAESG